MSIESYRIVTGKRRPYIVERDANLVLLFSRKINAGNSSHYKGSFCAVQLLPRKPVCGAVQASVSCTEMDGCDAMLTAVFVLIGEGSAI